MSQVDMFLEIPGVEGESQDAAFPRAIDVTSWEWGESLPCSLGSARRGEAGKVSMTDLTVTLPYGSASPALMLHCATGKHFDSAILTCRRADETQEIYLIIKLSTVVINVYQTACAGQIPEERMSLAFAKIQFEYRSRKRKGKKTFVAGYDILRREKI